MNNTGNYKCVNCKNYNRNRCNFYIIDEEYNNKKFYMNEIMTACFPDGHSCKNYKNKFNVINRASV